MAKKQIGDIDYNVEFNDSVLSTKTWNNPRYDGSKTETQVLNRFTQGDITYGKRTAVQKYTRNIYIGTNFLSAIESGLTPFPDFSYASSKEFITVNDDDSITKDIFESDNIEKKKGFYRAFNEDFKPNTKCKILLLDNSIQNTLRDNYNVYFSDGILQKIAHFNNLNQENDINGAIAPSGGTTFIWAEDVGEPFVSFSIFDNQYNPYNNFSGSTTDGDIVEDFFQSTADSYQESPDNRYFITLTQGPDFPYITSSIGTSLNVPILANTGSGIIPGLSQLSTAEYFTLKETFSLRYLNLSNKFAFNTNIHFDDSYGDFGGYTYGSAYYMGYYISRLNDKIPSILIDLNKESELPYGLIPGGIVEGNFQPSFNSISPGTKFVIIPENLHPYIKENINYFLIKAGLMEDNNNLTISPKNRQLS